MIEITPKPISPQQLIESVKSDSSGCIVTYIGLIRDNSRGKQVLSVEYEDPDGTARDKLQALASEAKHKWQLNGIAISHRVGKLKVGDINLVIALSSAHRKQGLAASSYLIDRFKEVMPTHKKETYTDGTIWVKGK